MSIIQKNGFPGCDAVVQLGADRANTIVKLLQLTDMQIIDAAQRRTPDRLRPDEIAAWDPANFDLECGDHIRSIVAQTRPDLIFITGDIVYGSFDDKGSTLRWICQLLDSFQIPWAPVFGNHDNESAMGVDWQCRQFEESTYCLFHRGTVTGNGNYTIGIAAGNQMLAALHMLDSNGCLLPGGIYPDQVQLVRDRVQQLEAASGQAVPSLVAFHIPTEEFVQAERAAGYSGCAEDFFNIGVDVPARGTDFGCKQESVRAPQLAEDNHFLDMAKTCHVQAVFTGHWHCVNTCITWENIQWVYGLKTGQYDYHLPGQIGGTLIRLSNQQVEVSHVPALACYGPYPRRAPMFRHFLTEE